MNFDGVKWKSIRDFQLHKHILTIKCRTFRNRFKSETEHAAKYSEFYNQTICLFRKSINFVQLEVSAWTNSLQLFSIA